MIISQVNLKTLSLLLPLPLMRWRQVLTSIQVRQTLSNILMWMIILMNLQVNPETRSNSSPAGCLRHQSLEVYLHRPFLRASDQIGDQGEGLNIIQISMTLI